MATQENTPGSSADRPRPTTAGTAARPCGTTQRHRPESPQPATSFFLRAIRPAHVNLRNHLSHFDTILSPPLLRRQNAVLEDMPSSSEDEDKFSIKPMPIYPAGAAEKRRCRICFSETEENGKFIVPCKCIGPIRYVHDNCFEDWLASSISPGECSTCNEPFSFSVTNHTCYDKARTSRRRSLLGTVVIVVATLFIFESYRCTEFQKIYSSELLEEGEEATDDFFADDRDFIWLPVIKHACSESSMIGTTVRFIWNSPFYSIFSLFALILFYRISNRRHRQQ